MVYYIVSGLLLMLFLCPYMAINVNVQYNGGFLPDIILWTQCYLHRVVIQREKRQSMTRLQKSMAQPGKVANPARGQRKNVSSLSVF